MTTKEKLIQILEDSGDEFISGSVIAEKLGITRSAIWKHIKQLESDGYRIEAVTNNGYRLSAANDAVSLSSLNRHLGNYAGRFTVEVHNSVASTNNSLKEQAVDANNWHVVVAGRQTAGRGRTGRSFFSPADSGVYLSVLLKQNIPVSDAGRLTTAAAVAACRAIEECTDAQPQIKWVNDVFVNEKKVCGILTEASVNFETGIPDWIITGIGFNVYEPEGGFPDELRSIAGAISKSREYELRSKISAVFLIRFYEICQNLYSPALLTEYRKRCFMLGKPVYVLREGKQLPALAVDINEDYALKVQYPDGSEEILNAGEVSTRPV